MQYYIFEEFPNVIRIHPTCASQYLGKEKEAFGELRELIDKNKDKVVAVGECGLEYVGRLQGIFTLKIYLSNLDTK